MRLFVAIPISQNIILKLEKVVPELQKILIQEKVKWVDLKALHLTLKFLGDTSESLLPKLKNSLHASIQNNSLFSISLGKIGFFPRSGPAKVLWVGVEEAGLLNHLAGCVEKETVSWGFAPQDRPFNAHLTLARFPALLPEKKNIEEKYGALEVGSMAVDRVQLIQSILSPQGPAYRILDEVLLKNGK